MSDSWKYIKTVFVHVRTCHSNSEEIDVVEMLGQDASRCSKQQEGKCLVQFNLGICMHAISLLHKSAHVFVPDEPMCAVDDRVHAE